jgi:tetratricopeptide (TPR) repeat protein
LTISAVLIVRDEEKTLASCLTSLRGVVDEIVVVDTGSQDRTIEVARCFTEVIDHFTWVDDFSAARNYALERAHGDYVLSIDADQEILERDKARGHLDAFMRAHPPEVVGTVQIHSPFYLGGKPQQEIEVAHRFFVRGCYRYEGSIHEQLVPVSGKKEAAPTGVRLFHTGYTHAPSSPENKAHRNKRMLCKELEKHPHDEYYLYQLGRSHFSLEEFEQAVGAFERALNAIDFTRGEPPRGRTGASIAAPVLTDLLALAAYAYVNVAALGRARTLLETHQDLGHVGTFNADFSHALGYVYLMSGDVARSRQAYLKSLAFGPDTELVRGTGSFASHYHLGLLSEADGDLPSAMNHFLQALCIHPAYDMAMARAIDFVVDYHVEIPKQMWDVADHEALKRMFTERFVGYVAEKKNAEAHLMIQAAAALSPELLAACQEAANVTPAGSGSDSTMN